MATKVDLYGRIFVRGNIRAITGLHIGRGKEELEIGGVENAVVRDPLTNRPYIPGSSLKGKMRSLWEKMTGREQNFLIGRIKGKEVRVHVCEELETYQECPVCPIYGVPGDKGSSNPTRLVVRDVLLSDAEAEHLEKEAHTDLPYTEVKWEAAIDRVTSAAVPRQMERVPAKALFDGLEMVFSVYEKGDFERFVNVFEAMQLLEDD
ncbi:MAG: type III-A CRISPR-associated RAMP protein Csm3, partial [Anaerolineae bacterium]